MEDLNPVPVTVPSTRKTLFLQNNGLYGNYLGGNLIGSGHQGPEMMTRIVMSLKSEMDTEVEWALMSLSQISCTSSSLINLEKMEYLGYELSNYFIKPFHLIFNKKYDEVSQHLMLLSLDSLLSLRNLVQDLENQQWLSQLKSLKRHLVEVLRFYLQWFHYPGTQVYKLKQYHNQFREGFNYLLDLLEPLSCYYTDNTKNDPLFNQLLHVSLLTKDKYVLVSSMRILSHLLFIKQEDEEEKEEREGREKSQDAEEEEVKIPNNCIDAVEEKHLQKYVNCLLIADNELLSGALEFIKQYLFSTALHPAYPHSVKDSQICRLKKLLQLSSDRSIFDTLIKELPILIVSGLPLSGPSKLDSVVHSSLIKRVHHSSVPTVLPQLSKQLYDIIVKFPEPLRATTWLRCCYEPYTASNEPVHYNSQDVIPGEVTQISLWKAYEKQFEEVWQTSKSHPNPEWPPLLPAVDFIKNVNSAFPNSEAMVVNLKPESPDKPAKKKFIIKGIQPRQFVVNIDVGNYEALKHVKEEKTSDQDVQETEGIAPMGRVDFGKFQHSLQTISNEILDSGVQMKDARITEINVLAREVFNYIFEEALELSDSEDLKKSYRLHNAYWLPDITYYNPDLIDSGFVDSRWLKYLA